MTLIGKMSAGVQRIVNHIASRLESNPNSGSSSSAATTHENPGRRAPRSHAVLIENTRRKLLQKNWSQLQAGDSTLPEEIALKIVSHLEAKDKLALAKGLFWHRREALDRLFATSKDRSDWSELAISPETKKLILAPLPPDGSARTPPFIALAQVTRLLVLCRDSDDQLHAWKQLEMHWQHFDPKDEHASEVMENMARALPAIRDPWIRKQASGRVLEYLLGADMEETHWQSNRALLSGLAAAVGTLKDEAQLHRAFAILETELNHLKARPEQQLPVLSGLTGQIWTLPPSFQQRALGMIEQGLALTHTHPELHVAILTGLTDVMQLPQCRDRAYRLVQTGLSQLEGNHVLRAPILRGLALTISKSAYRG